MDVDITTEPLGTGTDGEPVYLRDIWPSPQDVAAVVGEAITSDMYASSYADVFAGTERWQAIEVPAGETFSLGPGVDLRPQAPVLRRHAARARAAHRHHRREGAGQARRLGHDRPHQPRGQHPRRLAGRQVPAGARREAQGLQQLRLAPRQPRGHDPRDLRQHPPAQPARAGHRGRLHGQGRRADDDLRGVAGLPGRGDAAGDPRRQGVRLRAPRATGRPRAPRCSASAPSSPSRTSASTARTSSGWASCRCSTAPARTPSRSG